MSERQRRQFYGLVQDLRWGASEGPVVGQMVCLKVDIPRGLGLPRPWFLLANATVVALAVIEGKLTRTEQ